MSQQTDITPHFGVNGISSKPEERLDSKTFLEHFGVKGMKWGTRKRSAKEEKERAKRFKTKEKRRTLSDQDLDSYIKRLQNEKKLKGLIEEDLTPGRAYVKRLMSESGQKTAKAVAVGAGGLAVKVAINRKLEPTDLGKYLVPKPPKAPKG